MEKISLNPIYMYINMFFKICIWFHDLQPLTNRMCQLKHSQAVHNFINKADYLTSLYMSAVGGRNRGLLLL